MPYAKITKAAPDKNGWIEIGLEAKKSRARKVAIAPEVVEAVEAYRAQEKAEHDAVIFTSEGAVTSSNTLLQWLKYFYKKHGKTVQSHDFRHSKTTHFYRASGNDIKATQAMLGHADIKNT